MNMKNTIIRNGLAVFVAVLVLALSGCTKYLDIKPYGKTIPKTAEEFSALLQSTLEKIDFGEETIIGNPSSVGELEAYAENLEANLTIYPQGNFLPLYVGSHLSNQQSHYGNLYESIRDANLIIGYLEEKESTLGRKVMGSAYAIRGICYYNLLRDFCEPCTGRLDLPGVPLVTEFDMEAKPRRSTVGKTVNQIEADLNKAIEYQVNDVDFKFSPMVMKGYLARLYFWTGEWQKALTLAQEVLNAYPLVGPGVYKEMMESQVAPKGNYIIKSYIVVDGTNQIQFDAMQSTLLARPASSDFVHLFLEKEKDVRYSLSLNEKRLPIKKLSAGMRAAEMQLIVAESNYHLGNQAAALKALNDLRRNRITPYTDYTMETLPDVKPEQRIRTNALGNPVDKLLSAILGERQKELFMEGDRWYELKRNGRPEFWVARQGRKYTTMKFMYTFPLPIKDVQLVEGLVQNDGYDKVE